MCTGIGIVVDKLEEIQQVMKRGVAISGGRDAVADFVQRGVKLTPPPVKMVRFSQTWYQEMRKT